VKTPLAIVMLTCAITGFAQDDLRIPVFEWFDFSNIAK
jgi:hypothetical protein